MEPAAEIKELREPGELAAAYPVMRQLRPDVTPDGFIDSFRRMQAEGYRLFALVMGDRPLALAGVAVMTNLYHGRHVWVYDLVTDETRRSEGLGARLLSFVEEFARREGCEHVALSSALWRTDAHRFYQNRMGYGCTSYVFVKRL